MMHRTLFLLVSSALTLQNACAWNFFAQTSSFDSERRVRGLQNKSNGTAAVTLEVIATSSPTESAAPSPSPSETPTSAPTVTSKPTMPPTSAPTESQAPSPSPSETPSQKPSRRPSSSPTQEPTTTPYPTMMPSDSPTRVPSSTPSYGPTQAPTVTVMPSSQPSISPSALPSSSPSVSPSSSPTFVGTQSAFFTVHLDLHKKLNQEEQLAFVTGTEEYLDNLEMQGGLSLPQVTLEFQALVTEGSSATFSSNGTSSTLTTSTDYDVDGVPPGVDRRLGVTTTTTVENTSVKLQMNFQVTAIYSGPNTLFDLFETMNPLFQEPDELWIHMLGNYNDVFIPLRPDATSAIEGTESTDGRAMSSGGLASILVLALVAVGLALAASVYSVRSHTLSNYGEALESPRNSEKESAMTLGMIPTKENFTDDGSKALFDSRSLPQKSSILQMRSEGEEVPYKEDDLARPPVLTERVLTDLNTLNQKMETLNQTVLRADVKCDDPGNSIPFQRRRQGSVDPPTMSEAGGMSEANYEQYGFAVDSRTHQARLISKALGNRPTSYHNSNAGGRLSAQDTYSDNIIIPTKTYYDNDHELTLTKSKGGTLGAATYRGDDVSPSSGFSSHAESFFNNILAGKKKKQSKKTQEQYEMGNGTLGARPLNDNVHMRQEEEHASFGRGGAGLYDVFAPAGPIGIVVDTTKDGPCVHSLKSTSPMLGLINPGDLVVGLDDEDTRGMTAATLTRLMAKKSNQKERKITLLTVGGY